MTGSRKERKAGMMLLGRLLLVALGMLWLGSSSLAAEVVYPGGYDLSMSYATNSATVMSTDTLVVTRTLINETSFSLHGLYFSDNLSPNFRLVRYVARRNGMAIGSGLTVNVKDPVLVGQVEYLWVLDTPGPSPIELQVNPGDTVKLVEEFVCQLPGTYHLPLHTTVFYSHEAGGFFATSDAQTIVVTVATDVDDPHDVPTSYFVSTAYPNPFNGPVTIQFAGARLGERLTLTIINAAGQIVYECWALPARRSGTITWRPARTASSGVYFYSLRSAGRSSRGKLVLLK